MRYDAATSQFLTTAPIIREFASPATIVALDAYRSADKAVKAVKAETYTADYQADFRAAASMGAAYTKPYMKEIDARLRAANLELNACRAELAVAFMGDDALWDRLAETHAQAVETIARAQAEIENAESIRKVTQEAGRRLRPLDALPTTRHRANLPPIPGGMRGIFVFDDSQRDTADRRDVFELEARGQ